MDVDKTHLLDFMHRLDNEVSEQYVLLAAGGTALTLHGVKISTKDVDFVVQHGSLENLANVCSRVSSICVDLFERGVVFNNPLPDSCMARAEKMMQLNRITLLALDRIDVVMTKIARASESDIEDIFACRDSGVTVNDVYKMITEYHIDTPELRNNLRFVIREVFGIDEGPVEEDMR